MTNNSLLRLNINGSTDPSYRYKMPKIVGKIEGRGNGIKTVIVNAEQVAQALKRPTEQLTKYIALEFSALCYDLDGKQTINGKFETSDLQNHVQSYIKRFVLCPKCNNPETVQALRGKGKQASVVLECKACGEESEADNLHKLKTLIVNQLKEKTVETKGESKKGKSSESKTEAIDGGGVAESEKSSEKEKKPKKTKKPKKGKEENDGDSGEKKKKKKKSSSGSDGEKKEKKKKKSSKSKKKHESDDEVEDDSHKKYARAMEDASLKGIADDIAPLVAAEPVDVAKIITTAAALLRDKGLPRDDLIHIVWGAAIAKNPRPAAAVEKYAKLLNAAIDEVGMDEGPAYILACVEEALVDQKEETLDRVIKLVPLMLKSLFDNDVLDDSHIIRWFSGELKPTPSSVNYGLRDEAIANKARLQSKPLIDWLLADSSEEDSDEDSEDEDSSPRAANNKKSSKSDTETSDDDDGDDDED